MIAAIGSDGRRLVVWGMGATAEIAIEDARHWLTANAQPEPREVETCTADDLRTVEISEEVAARVLAGDVGAEEL